MATDELSDGQAALNAAREIVDYLALPDSAEPADSNGSPTEYIAKIILRNMTRPGQSEEAKMSTNREVVQRWLQGLRMAIQSCRDVTTLGRFAGSVDPVRWVAELQTHLERLEVTSAEREERPLPPSLTRKKSDDRS